MDSPCTCIILFTYSMSILPWSILSIWIYHFHKSNVWLLVWCWREFSFQTRTNNWPVKWTENGMTSWQCTTENGMTSWQNVQQRKRDILIMYNREWHDILIIYDKAVPLYVGLVSVVAASSVFYYNQEFWTVKPPRSWRQALVSQTCRMNSIWPKQICE